MHTETLEGIVVKSIPYQDNKRIFSLFTEKGLIPCIADVKDNQPNRLLVTTPLSKGEFVIIETKGGLKKIHDASLIRSYLHYKNSYALLESASLCLKAITLSQLEQKPSCVLYQLLSVYLEKILDFEDPYIITSSFLLKLLRFEGLLSLDAVCNACERHPSKGFVDLKPSCGCIMHPESILFDPVDWQKVKVLAYAKEIPFLKSLECSKAFHEKIKKLFEGCFR